MYWLENFCKLNQWKRVLLSILQGKHFITFLKIRKISGREIEISVPSPKESSSPNLSQPSRTKLQVPEQNISNNFILPESLCLKEFLKIYRSQENQHKPVNILYCCFFTFQLFVCTFSKTSQC